MHNVFMIILAGTFNSTKVTAFRVTHCVKASHYPPEIQLIWVVINLGLARKKDGFNLISIYYCNQPYFLIGLLIVQRLMHKDDWNCVTCLCSLQEMLGLGGSGRGQQPQMRGGPVPPQQQQPGGDSFNRYAVLSIIRKQYSKQNNGFYYTNMSLLLAFVMYRVL